MAQGEMCFGLVLHKKDRITKIMKVLQYKEFIFNGTKIEAGISL